MWSMILKQTPEKRSRFLEFALLVKNKDNAKTTKNRAMWSAHLRYPVYRNYLNPNQFSKYCLFDCSIPFLYILYIKSIQRTHA